MDSGNSSGRGGSGSRSFVVGSDDVFRSCDDHDNPNGSNRNRSMSQVKDFQELGAARPFPNIYSQQDEYNKQDMVSSIDKCMKKYVDNLLGFHEGISDRLSKLEAYCYNLENSVGELRSDLLHEQKKSDSKLKSLEKHFQEVNRSVQILRNKQELADTQKELTKLQLAQKDSSDRLATSASEHKTHDGNTDTANQQLALALPQQAFSHVPLLARSPELTQSYNQQPVHHPAVSSSLNIQQKNQGSSTTFIPQQSLPLQYQQISTLHPEVQYVPQRHQTQDVSRQQPPIQPLGQSPPFLQYQQQRPQQSPSQQSPQQIVQKQQGPLHSQFQTQSPSVNSSYQSHQTQAQNFPSSTPIPSHDTIPRSTEIPQESAAFGYARPGGINSQRPPPVHNVQRPTPMHALQAFPGPQLNSSGGGYMNLAPYPPYPSHEYMSYDNDGNRSAHFSTINHGNYPPALQNQQQHTPGSNLAVPSQHPHGELIEKCAAMGYTRDSIISAINRMQESGLAVDFNSLLDTINHGLSSGTQRQRGWTTGGW